MEKINRYTNGNYELTVKEWHFNKIRDIDKLEEEIKAIKVKISNERSSMHGELRRFTLTQDDIDFLYWETTITKKIIAESMGKTARDIRTNDKLIPITCKCGAIIENLHATNKTEYELMKKQVDNREKLIYKSTVNKHIEVKYVCSKCEGEKWKIKNYELRHMPYKQYLQTEHWKNVRQKALHRSANKCQLCNSDYRLNVHHRTYENRGDEKPSDLIALCGSCHEKFHKNANLK